MPYGIMIETFLPLSQGTSEAVDSEVERQTAWQGQSAPAFDMKRDVRSRQTVARAWLVQAGGIDGICPTWQLVVQHKALRPGCVPGIKCWHRSWAWRTSYCTPWLECRVVEQDVSDAAGRAFVACRVLFQL